MNKSLLLLNTAVVLVSGSALRGQHTAAISTTALVKPLPAVPNTQSITGTQTMIVNRSHVLKDSVDGMGSRYFSLSYYSDLAGKTPEEQVARLTPTAVTPQQNVRTMNVVIDIEHPLFFTSTTSGKTPFMIGTTIIQGKVQDLQVNSDISLGTLKITKK